MSGVRQQRQRAGNKPSDRLCEHENAGQSRGYSKREFISAPVVMRMGVSGATVGDVIMAIHWGSA